MLRNTLTVTLLALVVFSASFIAPQEAHASTQAQAAYRAAMNAHRFAQTKSQQAGRIQAGYGSALAKFNAGAASSNQVVRYHAKRAFIVYLRDLQRALRAAISAHDNARRHWAVYNRVSGTTGGSGNIASLTGAITRFQATINQAQAHINIAGNVT